MINALSSINISPGSSIQGLDRMAATGGAEFKSLLVDAISQLDGASPSIEQTALSSVVGSNPMAAQSLASIGQTDAALGVMMQIQDRLLGAYQEIQNIRV